MADALTVFWWLVLVLILLALVFQLVPFMLYLVERRAEEKKIVEIVKATGQEVDPIELSEAFNLLKVQTTAVTRTTLAMLPLAIVGIAIFYLITSNNMILMSITDNTTITANSTISNTIATSNSLINTLLGVLAGFLTAAAGFYFGAKSVGSRPCTDNDEDDDDKEKKLKGTIKLPGQKQPEGKEEGKKT
jgi:hypothetical protein